MRNQPAYRPRRRQFSGRAAHVLAVALALALAVSGCGDDDDAADTGPTPDQRAREIVAAMTLAEKISQTHGAALPEDFRIVLGIPELGIPALTVTNGPAGVGPGPQILNNVPATALPSPLLLASTWDPQMAARYGDVQGIEMRAIGRNLLEAPDVDLARVPINGRTFEAYGEDPELVSRLGVANIRAIQSHDIVAMVKHYAANNQEAQRASIDVRVSERALRELYLPPFEAAGERPLFPFGFGLSYTTFRIDQLELSRTDVAAGETLEVAVSVENTGQRSGAEVVQVYVAYPTELGEPPKQLRAFQRVELMPGESRRVRMQLGERALAIWDTPSHAWIVRPGSYEVLVGNSSIETPLHAELIVR